ncbi:Holliday junction resolvase RecU [Priestia aryabhattai]|uniref:Holliday junction resolvase RecU n=1 Tax=Priestia aryabhattai TaxID=412384 RepID=A0ABD7X482_PRIAR|nr:Holliday junction resolvase RecU [Priestia aryabhattai]WEA47318.1 Holliday junction resolvase RecU [Priestia aryabhattai]
MARGYKKRNSHANRGKDLEMYILQANERYSLLEVAEIEQIPVPIGIDKVDSKTKKITNAFFKDKSTVDFLGVSNGKFIAFDAKETEDPNKFPLQNVHEHQYKKLKQYVIQGGLSFLLVHFKVHQETYILRLLDLSLWWENDTSSIPYDFFKSKCIKCGPGRNVPIDYLASLPT